MDFLFSDFNRKLMYLFDIKFFSLIVVQVIKACRNYLFSSKFYGNKSFLSMFNELDENNYHLHLELHLCFLITVSFIWLFIFSLFELDAESHLSFTLF